MVSVEVDGHLAAGGRPEDAEWLHGGREVSGGDDGVHGAGNPIHDQLHAVLVGTKTQGNVVAAVGPGEDPLVLFRTREDS